MTNAQDALQAACHSCGRRIKGETISLELNSRTGRFTCAVGLTPAEDSQGWFTFGADCAMRILKAAGTDHKRSDKARSISP